MAAPRHQRLYKRLLPRPLSSRPRSLAVATVLRRGIARQGAANSLVTADFRDCRSPRPGSFAVQLFPSGGHFDDRDEIVGAKGKRIQSLFPLAPSPGVCGQPISMEAHWHWREKIRKCCAAKSKRFRNKAHQRPIFQA